MTTFFAVLTDIIDGLSMCATEQRGEEVGQQPVSGNNLVLTIDFDVQKRRTMR